MKRCVLIFACFLLMPSAAFADNINDVLNGLGEVSVRGYQAQDRIESMGRGELRELVTRGLERKDARTRERVLRAAADKKLEELYPLIVETGRHDPDWRVRVQAVVSADRLKGIAAADFIRSELNDKSSDVQAVAINSVSNFADAADTKILMEKLRSDSPRVQLAAAKALVARHEKFDKSVISRFVVVSTSASRDRNSAIQLLGDVGDDGDAKVLKEIVDTPNANGADRFDAMVSIVGIRFRQLPDSEKISFLKSKLSDKRDSNRDWAARKLLEYPEGHAILADAAGNESHPGHRNAQYAISLSKMPQWKRLHSRR